MASLYRRLLIIITLLLAFASRSIVYAVPGFTIAREITKKRSSSEAEKPESLEKQNQLEEKVKLSDLHLAGDLKFDFLPHNVANQHLFSENFILDYCHLQVPEQPPK